MKSLSESIDTSTAMRNLFFQFMRVLAEHERNVIWERTKAGLKSARARGRSGGRPEELSKRYQKIAVEVIEMYERNVHSTNAIREMFQIKSQPTVYKILQFAGSDVKGFVKKRGNVNQKIKNIIYNLLILSFLI